MKRTSTGYNMLLDAIAAMMFDDEFLADKIAAAVMAQFKTACRHN
jgi:hypothetical protein